jgi:hypothetical protein
VENTKKEIDADTLNPFANKFEMKNNLIKMVNNSGPTYSNCWHKMAINEVIPKNKIYSFKVKIVNTQSRYITVGIADRLTARNNSQYVHGDY